MTLAAILVPHWVSMDIPVVGGDKVYSQHLGLHHYCNTALPDKPCRSFPDTDKDCTGDDKNFCSMWRTSGFLMNFATVAELATLVCFVVTIGGGKVKREYGWKVLSGLLGTVAVTQFIALGLVVGYRRGSMFLRPALARWFMVVQAGLTRTPSPLRFSATCSRTTTTSASLTGSLAFPGSCARSVQVWRRFWLVGWGSQRISCRRKTMATTSSLILSNLSIHDPSNLDRREHGKES